MLTWLQLAGGTFPTGSFNHSYGLETYIQSGRVRSAADVEAVLLAYMDVYIQTDLIFVNEAYEAIRRNDTDAIETLQFYYSASKSASELHAASLKTGRSLLLGVKNLYADQPPEAFGRLKDPAMMYHYALAYGLAAAIMELPFHETAQTYIYAGLASLVSVATRIIPLGQNESQLVLFRLGRRLSELKIEDKELTLEKVNTFSPGLEIASMAHETLYTRLCMS